MFDIKRVAKLARLHLTDDELQEISKDISKVINSFQRLQSVSTEGVEPMVISVPMEAPLRDDECLFDREMALLELAPERAGSLYKVPPVIS